jgi:hypothetical protein
VARRRAKEILFWVLMVFGPLGLVLGAVEVGLHFLARAPAPMDLKTLQKRLDESAACGVLRRDPAAVRRVATHGILSPHESWTYGTPSARFIRPISDLRSHPRFLGVP